VRTNVLALLKDCLLVCTPKNGYRAEWWDGPGPPRDRLPNLRFEPVSRWLLVYGSAGLIKYMSLQ
jgi:hypothetical protein